MNKYQLTYKELQTIHALILWDRMVDPKNRKLMDRIGNKIVGQMEEMEIYHQEDIEDSKHRRKIVK